MKQVSVLIKPASSLCNLRCKYCFYADVSSLREVRSFGHMTEDTADKMISSIFKDLEDGDNLTLAFQGGEPTLAGLKYFESIIELVTAQQKQVQVHYSLQTNGMVVNERWCTFLKAHDFLVGLSIDGNPIYHDMNRVDAKGRGTFQRVMQTKELFDQYGVEYNVLCVLTNPLAKEAKKVFHFLKDNHIRFVQFIPCLDELNAENRSKYALTPQRFASFYHQLLKLWLAELESGNYISVKLFDDICNLFVHHQVNACGLVGNCQVQYVIEADGSVYPCDFYVLDEYRLGYIQEQGLKELFEQNVAKVFLAEKREVHPYCGNCQFWNMCHGGCKRMKDATYVTKQEDYCGYQAVLKTVVPEIEKIMELAARIHM